MALFVYGLAAGELSRNGGRRALVAAAEHRGGGWLVPTLSGEPLLTKPPGTSIAIALASLPEGRGTAVTARLPSALAALAVAVLLCLGWAAAVGWDALAETARREALLRLSPATTRGPTRGASWSPFPLTFLPGGPPWSALALRTLRRGLAGCGKAAPAGCSSHCGPGPTCSSAS